MEQTLSCLEEARTMAIAVNSITHLTPGFLKPYPCGERLSLLSTFLLEKLDSDACYAFPEPAERVSTTVPSKDQAMIHSWVKYCSLLLHSMTGLSFQAKPQLARAWEALLTAEYVSTHNQDLDRKRQKLRNDMISFVGHMELDELDELSLSTADAKWEGQVVGELTATDYERILWELVVGVPGSQHSTDDV